MGQRKPLSMTARKHHYYMGDAMRRLEWDLHNAVFEARRIPKDWCEIAARNDTSRTRVTMRVDDDVLKFFRSMGPGYQARINDVLRVFMHAKLAGLIHGEETIEPFREHEDAGARRPDWGWVEEQMAEIRGRK